MVFLLVPTISLAVIIIGKLILGKWFNHITLYCVIWSGLILFYEMKLISYPDITPIAWFLIISTFLAFLLGTLTIVSAKNVFSDTTIFSRDSELNLALFQDNGQAVKYFTIFFSVISLLGALQHWMVLINKFGSIPAVFLNASVIYKLNVHQGGEKGMIPFVSNFGYVAIFLSAIFTAYKGRFSFITFLPFISIIVKELATIGRFGMLLALMEFVFAFFLFRHLLTKDRLNRFKFSKRNAIMAASLLIIILIVSASFVRITRGASESFSGATRELRQMEDNILISPSLYLYVSSDLGVLTKFLNSSGEDTKFGQNTFLTLYHVLDKFDVVKRESDYQKGYYIPMWANTGTYIRELYADFGITGTLLVPYLLGLLITWLWFEFYRRNNFIILTFLVYLLLIIGFSFLVMVTRSSYWSISQFLIILFIPVVERFAKYINFKSSYAYKSPRTA
jgi:oligosaccharide repeat unit polymerase